MAFRVSDKTLTQRLNRYLARAKSKESDSLEKLSSGTVFTSQDPRPADRAIAEKMDFRLKSLSSAKRNVNDAMSLLQTAESSMSEVNNTISRLKEINLSAASTTVSPQERRYLFIEFDALYDEINRIALTTEFNGIPLLNGESDATPEELIFRVGDPFLTDSGFDSEDINTIRFEGLRDVTATTEALGLKSVRDLLDDSSDAAGIDLEDAEDMLLPDDDELFATVYDEAINKLSSHRAVFGALQTRMNKALDFIDVYEENIAAAKSVIADTDYATEVSNFVQSKIQASATTSLLAQANINSNQTFQLLNAL
ncbi:MAG: flagellin [Oligoflexales bacterium]